MWKLDITPGDRSYEGVSLSRQRLSSHVGGGAIQCLVAQQQAETVAVISGSAYDIDIEFVDEGVRVKGTDVELHYVPLGASHNHGTATLISDTDAGKVTWSLTQIAPSE